jgi:hypothetical protein
VVGTTHGQLSDQMKVGGSRSVLLRVILSLSAAILLIIKFDTNVDMSVRQRFPMLEAKEQASYAVGGISSITKNSIRKSAVKDQGPDARNTMHKPAS